MRTALVALALVACHANGAPSTPAPEPTPAAAPAAPAAPAPAPAAAPAPAPAAERHPGLLDPSQAAATAPERYKARFETTQGTFVLDVRRDWAPLGADRFHNLVSVGFYDDVAFFRAIDGFMVQFGISGDPDVNRAWREARIQDDPRRQSNSRGRISFATSGPNSRTTQVFVNYSNNAPLDGMGFSPFGEVVEGMDVLDRLYKGYGEGAPRGRGPSQGILQERGNAYLKESFPRLDYVVRATIE